MRPMPIVYVRDVDAARRFYGGLGMRVRYVAGHDRGWVELENGDAVMAIHRLPENGEPSVELTFESDRPLSEVEPELVADGFSVSRPAADEAFGESIRLKGPDGGELQLNWFDPDLRGQQPA